MRRSAAVVDDLKSEAGREEQRKDHDKFSEADWLAEERTLYEQVVIFIRLTRKQSPLLLQPTMAAATTIARASWQGVGRYRSTEKTIDRDERIGSNARFRERITSYRKVRAERPAIRP
jgi:hypothetical protein